MKGNSYKKSNKKPMLVECTVHICGSCLVMTPLLASPVQAFPLQAEDFFFPCASLFFKFDLLDFSSSAISSLSDMVSEEAEQGI